MIGVSNLRNLVILMLCIYSSTPFGKQFKAVTAEISCITAVFWGGVFTSILNLKWLHTFIVWMDLNVFNRNYHISLCFNSDGIL